MAFSLAGTGFHLIVLCSLKMERIRAMRNAIMTAEPMLTTHIPTVEYPAPIAIRRAGVRMPMRINAISNMMDFTLCRSFVMLSRSFTRFPCLSLEWSFLDTKLQSDCYGNGRYVIAHIWPIKPTVAYGCGVAIVWGMIYYMIPMRETSKSATIVVVHH